MMILQKVPIQQITIRNGNSDDEDDDDYDVCHVSHVPEDVCVNQPPASYRII